MQCLSRFVPDRTAKIPRSFQLWTVENIIVKFSLHLHRNMLFPCTIILCYWTNIFHLWLENCRNDSAQTYDLKPVIFPRLPISFLFSLILLILLGKWLHKKTERYISIDNKVAEHPQKPDSHFLWKPPILKPTEPSHSTKITPPYPPPIIIPLSQISTIEHHLRARLLRFANK